MGIKHFNELFYIRCPYCGHWRSVAEVPQARAKLDQELFPDEELCPQVQNLLASLDLTCDSCGEKEPEISCVDARDQVSMLLNRYKSWLYQRERKIIESFYEQMDKNDIGLTWKQIAAFERIKLLALWRASTKITASAGRGGGTK